MLLISCLAMVALLSAIQFFLVRNTYELSRRQYYGDVKQALDAVSQPFTDSANSRAMRLFQQYLPGYDSSRRKTFIEQLSGAQQLMQKRDDSILKRIMSGSPTLERAGFSMQYRQVILIKDGVRDTVLSAEDHPFILLGKYSAGKEQLAVGAGSQTAGISGIIASPGMPVNRIEVKYEQVADISQWKTEVWKRMAGIFLLAVGFIIALLILFYIVIRTLLRQKRITDVTNDFANNMTHELKTPLSSIAIIIKSMLNKSVRAQPEMMDELINSLSNQHNKLHRLTDQVLETSLLEKQTAVYQEIEMNSFLHNCFQEFRNDTHIIKMEIRFDTMKLRTDPVLLESIIYNLMDNAIKYSEPATEINLTAFGRDQSCYIEIADHGRGIELKDQLRIFDKFYRVPEDNLHSVKGLGLGLYLCRVKAAMLKADLFVVSTPGEGSVFSLKLPIQ